MLSSNALFQKPAALRKPLLTVLLGVLLLQGCSEVAAPGAAASGAAPVEVGVVTLAP